MLCFLFGFSSLTASLPNEGDTGRGKGEVIYISSDVIMHGEVFMNNTKIVQIEERPHFTKVKKYSAKAQKLSTLKFSKKEEKKKVKEKKSASKFYFIPTEKSQERLQASLVKITAAISSFRDYTNSRVVVKNVLAIKRPLNFIAQIKVQNFYFSYSWLQFEKYENYSLRGPPFIS